jgi:hypothetical protein
VFVARGRLVGLVLAATALLTGCGGSSAPPRSLPPLTATDTPSPGPAPSTTATSNHAELAAATAVVREYFHAKNLLSRTMSIGELKAVTTTSCSCRELVRQAQRLKQAGKKFFGAAHITGMTPVADSSSAVEVLVVYNSSAGGTKDHGGRVIYQGAAHRDVTQLFTIRRVGARWLVADIKLVHPGRTA